MKRDRIRLEDAPMSAIMKLVEGNPGATTVCADIFKIAHEVDPDAALEGMAPIFQLDTMGIYGSRIWMLYKDVCKGNIVKVIAVLRAVQLGLISVSILNHAIDNYGEGLDINEAHMKVKECLPNFVAPKKEGK
jgi:hypothetical protein